MPFKVVWKESTHDIHECHSEKDTPKVQTAELKLGHFMTSESGAVPYILSKSQLKLADDRLSSFRTPVHIDFVSNLCLRNFNYDTT